MRIVVAVDWSDQAFAAVQAVTRLYSPTTLTLVHAVDLGVFEHPAVAQAMVLQGYDDFRRAMCDAGQQLLDQTSALAPPDGPAVRRVCEIGSPADVILDTARSAAADLVVVGARGRGRMAELVLGSVSHRVLTHAACSALVVKGSLGVLRRVLLAVEGPDDSGRLVTWLRAHPFNKPVEVSVISVAPTPHYGDPAVIPAIRLWGDASLRVSQELVEGVVARLDGPGFTATGRALEGDPAEVIGREAAGFDLVVVGSHGRKGVSRFLLGSVSHSVSHKVACPILVIR